MVFSGFSHLSRNFLANFREGARKRLNLAENWGGLGIIRDDLGSCSKVLKTVWAHAHVGSNPTPSAILAAKNRTITARDNLAALFLNYTFGRVVYGNKNRIRLCS